MPCICGIEDVTTETHCQAMIKGDRAPTTAEELMRARYAAYALGEVDYILETHAPEATEDVDRDAIQEWSDSAEWNGLEIVSTEKGGEGDADGVVEFIARYTAQDTPQVHHERATFRKDEGKWLFVDGEMVKPKPIRREEPKVGRNDPCPCGSGKKYKKCCALKAAE